MISCEWTQVDAGQGSASTSPTPQKAHSHEQTAITTAARTTATTTAATALICRPRRRYSHVHAADPACATSAAPQMTNQTDDAVRALYWQRRHAVAYGVGVSYSYHRKRQRFFDLLDKSTRAAMVLLGASLLGEPLKQHLPLVAGAISGLGLLSLVIGYGERKQCHKELAEAFMQVRSAVDLVDFDDVTAARLTGWEADLSRLNGREPPTLNALVTICQNEQSAAMGRLDHVHPLPWHQRLLANWLSFSATA